MKQLTKKQRRDIYLKVAEIYSINQDKYYGICQYLREQMYISREDFYENGYIKMFDEFCLFKPMLSSRADNFWFSDIEERMTALLFCYEMTYDK